MKSHILILLLTGLFFVPNIGNTEINNRVALMSVFEGCVEDEDPDISVGAQFDYCGCFIKEISLGMDFDELMVIGLDMLDAGEDEQKQEKILTSNRKINSYVIKCANRLYE